MVIFLCLSWLLNACLVFVELPRLTALTQFEVVGVERVDLQPNVGERLEAKGAFNQGGVLFFF